MLEIGQRLFGFRCVEVMIMIGEVEMIGIVMVAIEVIVIIILAIFKEETLNTLYGVDLILLTTDAA
jgi:hypothetical protein